MAGMEYCCLCKETDMPKLKTKRSAAKRFTKTGKGKFRFNVYRQDTDYLGNKVIGDKIIGNRITYFVPSIQK